MPIFAIRHGLSEANNHNNIGTLAFAAKDAPLMEYGRKQAAACAVRLPVDYGIYPASTNVAVSTHKRTEETAQVIGFGRITPYKVLDEVRHGMEPKALRKLLDNGQLPLAALRAAEKILRKPPPHNVWVTHGLVIAGLSHVLGVSHQFGRLIPRFCEVRELPI